MIENTMFLLYLPLFLISYLKFCSGNALDWSTYGFNAQRSSINPKEYIISASSASRLRQKWVVEFPSPLIAQAVVAVNLDMTVATTRHSFRGLKVTEGWMNPLMPHAFGTVAGASNRTCTDAKSIRTMAYAGDIAGNFLAIDVDEGCVVWQASLGAYYDQGCGDLPSFGITGAAVFDRSVNTIYTMSGLGTFYALSMQTGAILWSIADAYDSSVLFSYGSLLLHNNVVYFTLASRCDLGAYQGGVSYVSIPTRTVSSTTFHPSGAYHGGGIWGLAGVTMNDPASPTPVIYSPTGNSFASTENSLYSEEIVGLHLDLSVVGNTSIPFNPLGEPNDNDFGSSAVYFNGPSEARANRCTQSLIAAGRKDGFYFVANADTFQVLQTLHLQTSWDVIDYIFQGAWDEASSTLVVPVYGNGTKLSEGLSAYTLGSNCQLTLKWHTYVYHVYSPSIAGPPGNRVVVVGGVFQIFVLNLQTGAIIYQPRIGGFSFNAPAITNGVLFVSSVTGALSPPGLLYAYNISGAVPTMSPTPSTVSPVSTTPSCRPSSRPSKPSNKPSSAPSAIPTSNPTRNPSSLTPSIKPSVSPIFPSLTPSAVPSFLPTGTPVKPSLAPSGAPSVSPSGKPLAPSYNPSTIPSAAPVASLNPSLNPTLNPSATPITPSTSPSRTITTSPSVAPVSPSLIPSVCPSVTTVVASLSPTTRPSLIPVTPSASPSVIPTRSPSVAPVSPSLIPSICPSTIPSVSPSATPVATSLCPTVRPSAIPITPSTSPSRTLTTSPSVTPTSSSLSPTLPPSLIPIASSVSPSTIPTTNPSVAPVLPSLIPSASPSISPSAAPVASLNPTLNPSATPMTPSTSPSRTTTSPSASVSVTPIVSSLSPTMRPSAVPITSSVSPSIVPTTSPSVAPVSPSLAPSITPIILSSPSVSPISNPTKASSKPTLSPTVDTSRTPSNAPSLTAIYASQSSSPSLSGPGAVATSTASSTSLSAMTITAIVVPIAICALLMMGLFVIWYGGCLSDKSSSSMPVQSEMVLDDIQEGSSQFSPPRVTHDYEL